MGQPALLSAQLGLCQGCHTEGGPAAQGLPLKKVQREFHQGVREQLETGSATSWQARTLAVALANLSRDRKLQVPYQTIRQNPKPRELMKLSCSRCLSRGGPCPLLLLERPGADTLPLWTRPCPVPLLHPARCRAGAPHARRGAGAWRWPPHDTLTQAPLSPEGRPLPCVSLHLPHVGEEKTPPSEGKMVQLLRKAVRRGFNPCRVTAA